MPPQYQLEAHKLLLEAAQQGEWSEVAALAEAGAPVDPEPTMRLSGGVDWVCDTTPLIYAVQQGDLAAVQMLLDRGADPNLAAELTLFATPLSVALWGRDFGDRRPHRDIVEALIRAGADPDLDFLLDPVHFAGYTLLHWAALENLAEAIEVLAAYGANVDVSAPAVETVPVLLPACNAACPTLSGTAFHSVFSTARQSL